MYDNIMDEMAKIATQASTAISASIIYQHLKNGALEETSNVLAVREPLVNFKVEGEYISSGRRFVISKDKDGNFLKQDAKLNDIVVEDGISWYVVTSFPSDVDLVVICSHKAFTLTTKKVKY